jgi:predicted membrane-bound spermidine synthase
MTESDKKVRKSWLLMLGVNVLLSGINMLFIENYDPVIRTMPAAFHYGMFAFSMSVGIGFAYLLYHCAYKKPGTKFLVFCMTMSLLGLISAPFLYFNGKIGPLAQVPLYKMYLVATQLIGIVWVVLCWKMRAVNHRRQSINSSPQ